VLLLGSSDGRCTSIDCGEKNCCVNEEAHCVMFRSKELMMLMKSDDWKNWFEFFTAIDVAFILGKRSHVQLCVENETKLMETLLHRRYNWSDKTADSDKYYLADVQPG
jgi:hypothetical protein